MKTFIYALIIDGETKFEERKDIMFTDDELFPFLKNCMYGPKVNFIKEDGSCSFGIQLIDYGFIINKNKSVLPLLPGSIIEGPIKKMNLQNTQQIIFQDKQSNVVAEQGADDSAYNDLCASVNEEKSFGMIGDDMMLQQEDIELEEEIVCLQTSEAGSLSPLVRQNQSETAPKSDRKTALRKNHFGKSFMLEDAQKESKSSESNDEDDQGKFNLPKRVSKSFNLKKKREIKINRDIKDVANALVNFSSINNKIILEKNREEVQVENREETQVENREEMQAEKIIKTKNNRKIKGSKLRKQGRRPSKLNITGTEQLDVQNSESEITEQLSIDSNIVNKIPENLQYNVQTNLDLLNNVTQQLDDISTIVTPENLQYYEQKTLNKLNISELKVDESQPDVASSVKEIPIYPIDILSDIALSEIKVEKDQQILHTSPLTHSNIDTSNDEINDTNIVKVISDNHGQIEDIRVNQTQFSEVKGEASNETNAIVDELISTKQRTAQIAETENTLKDLSAFDEAKMAVETNLLGIVLPVSICGVEDQNVKVESELVESTSDQLIDCYSNFTGRFIYALQNPNKKINVETPSIDSENLMQRLKVMEEERSEMRDEIRREQMKLQLWEQELKRREKITRRMRTYKKK